MFRRAWPLAFLTIVLACAATAAWLRLRPDRRPPASESKTLAEIAGVQGALARANEDLLAALRQGDARAYASAFAQDAVSLPGHGQIVRGQPAIEAAVRRTFERIQFVETAISTTDTQVNGESAVEVGRYRFTVFAFHTGRRQIVEGRYLAIWKRDEQGWKIAVDAAQPGAAE